MKFLIMSDNHGRHELVEDLVGLFKDQVDYFFHCGDSEFALQDPIWQNFAGYVAGNMDFLQDYPQQALIQTPAGKVLLVHGHRHQVNHTSQVLFDLASQNQARFVFHGHTHVLYSDYQEGVLMVNPGSLNHSRGPVRQTTFAIVTIEEATYQVEFRDESGRVLEDLTQTYQLLK